MYTYKISPQQYEKIRDCYWVCTYEGQEASWSSWVFSPERQPEQVPDPSMHWRRPTYEETIERQTVYDQHPDIFRRMCSETLKDW